MKIKRVCVCVRAISQRLKLIKQNLAQPYKCEAKSAYIELYSRTLSFMYLAAGL